MKRKVINLLKKILPSWVVMKIMAVVYSWRQSKRFESGRLVKFIVLAFNRVMYGIELDEYQCMHFERYSHREKNNFLTFDRGIMIDRICNSREADEILLEKQKFNEKFSKFIKRKWIYIDNNTADKEIEEFYDSLTRKEFIIKPNNSCGGAGIRKSTGIEELKQLRNDGQTYYIVEEMLKNHKDLDVLNSTSLNTLRVVTLIDKMGKVNIISMTLRTGAAGSVMDNAYSGGTYYHIDKDLGVVDCKGSDLNGDEYICHPSSGVMMLGYKIPMFDEIKQMSVELANIMPQARYVGWDIAVTENGLDVIEGNLCPGCMLHQCDGKGVYGIMKRMI